MRSEVDVDEILASGRYTDGRGWEWDLCTLSWCRQPDEWWSLHDMARNSGRHLTSAQMRLFIERDLHRSVCPGIWDCLKHPVPVVEIDGPIISGTGCFYVRPAQSSRRVDHRHDLESAMDAARRLAVSE